MRLAIHVLVVATIGVLAPLAAADDAPQLLTDYRGRVLIAKDLPGRPKFDWNAWIGGSVDVFRASDTAVALSADVETVIGNEKRFFEANQSAYHLEALVRHDGSWATVGAYFHHLSRHALDREVPVTVSWNDLGVRATRTVAISGRPTRLDVDLGYDVSQRNTGYRWDAQASLETEILNARDAGGYGRIEARRIAADPIPQADRGGFFDLRLETGARLKHGEKRADVFVAFERRNDALILETSREDRAMIGLRFGTAHLRTW